MFLSASLAYVFGPLGGGKLATLGFAVPFWVATGLLAAMLAWIALRFRETLRDRLGTSIRFSEAFTNLRNVFVDRRLRRLYLVDFLIYLAIFGFFRTYSMYLVDEFGLGVSGVSEFLAYVAVPVVIANAWLVGALAKRLSPRRTVAIFGLATGVLMTTIVLPDSLAGMWATLGPTGLAPAICLPATVAMISRATPPQEQGRALGNNQSLQVGAEALSGLAAGALAAAFFGLPLLVFAGAAIAGVAVLAGGRVARADPGLAQEAGR